MSGCFCGFSSFSCFSSFGFGSSRSIDGCGLGWSNRNRRGDHRQDSVNGGGYGGGRLELGGHIAVGVDVTNRLGGFKDVVIGVSVVGVNGGSDLGQRRNQGWSS